MEEIQSRIQNAVGKMISSLDKELLRKIQVICCGLIMIVLYCLILGCLSHHQS